MVGRHAGGGERSSNRHRQRAGSGGLGGDAHAMKRRHRAPSSSVPHHTAREEGGYRLTRGPRLASFPPASAIRATRVPRLGVVAFSSRFVRCRPPPRCVVFPRDRVGRLRLVVSRRCHSRRCRRRLVVPRATCAEKTWGGGYCIISRLFAVFELASVSDFPTGARVGLPRVPPPLTPAAPRARRAARARPGRAGRDRRPPARRRERLPDHYGRPAIRRAARRVIRALLLHTPGP